MEQNSLDHSVSAKRYTLTSHCSEAGELVWSPSRYGWVSGVNQDKDERLTAAQAQALLADMKQNGHNPTVTILDCEAMDAIQSVFREAFEANLPDGWQNLPQDERIAARTDAAWQGRNALIEAGLPTDYADGMGYVFEEEQEPEAEHETIVEYGVNEVLDSGVGSNPFEANFETRELAEQAARAFMIENPEVSRTVVFQLTIVDNTIRNDQTLSSIDRSELCELAAVADSPRG